MSGSSLTHFFTWPNMYIWCQCCTEDESSQNNVTIWHNSHKKSFVQWRIINGLKTVTSISVKYELFAKDIIKCKYMQKRPSQREFEWKNEIQKHFSAKKAGGEVWKKYKNVKDSNRVCSKTLHSRKGKSIKFLLLSDFSLQSWFIKFPMYTKTMFSVNPLSADFTLVRFVKTQNIFIQMSFGISNLLKYDLWPHIVQLSGKKVCTKRGLAILVLYIYLRRCGFGPFSSFFIELHSVDAATSIVFNIFERSSRTFELQGTSAWIWNNLKHKIK